MTEPRRLGPVPALDGLRGIAIVLVLVFHTTALTFTGDFTGIGEIDKVIGGGFLGVDLFFVLSGFLITALLLREQADRPKVSFGSFYIRRGLRLLPALYLLLLVHVIYVNVTHLVVVANEVTSVGSALLYVTNWQVTRDPLSISRSLGPLWSLSIEEQFYLIWPAVLIFFLGVRRQASTVISVMVGAIILIAMWRGLLWDHGWGKEILYFRTDTRADSLLIGALLAWCWVRHLTPKRGITVAAWIAVGVVVACLEFARADRGWLYYGGFDLFAVAIAALILAAVDGRWIGNRVLETPPLRLLGKVSYGVYLWHLFVFSVVVRYGSTWGTTRRILVAYPALAAVTAFSWFVVERPALNLKHRLDAKRRAEVPAPA